METFRCFGTFLNVYNVRVDAMTLASKLILHVTVICLPAYQEMPRDQQCPLWWWVIRTNTKKKLDQKEHNMERGQLK